MKKISLEKNYSFIFQGQLEKESGCLRPCKYLTYDYSDKMTYSSEYGPIPNTTAVEVSLLNPVVTVRQESYLYPFTSFVAETGGTLGLFLGFSFLMAYDVLSRVFVILIFNKMTNKRK